MMNMIGAALAAMTSAIAAGNPRANMVMRPGKSPLIVDLKGGQTVVVETLAKIPACCRKKKMKKKKKNNNKHHQSVIAEAPEGTQLEEATNE